MNKYLAEFIGTFWLVASEAVAVPFLQQTCPELRIGFLGVALAFGLTVLTGTFALRHISGGHFNPAVVSALWVGGRFDTKDLIPYVVSQVVGAVLSHLGVIPDCPRTAGFAVQELCDQWLCRTVTRNTPSISALMIELY